MSDQNDASKRLHDSDRNDDDSLFGKEAEQDLSSSPVQVFDSFGGKDDRDVFSDRASSDSQGNPYGGSVSPQGPNSQSANTTPYTAANPYQQAYGQPYADAGSAQPYTAAGQSGNPYAGSAQPAGAQPYAGAAGPGVASGVSGSSAAGGAAGAAGGADGMPPYQPYAGGQVAGSSVPYGQYGYSGSSGQAYPGGYPDGYASAPAPSTGKATGALVCGILAILFSGTVLPSIILGIAAIVLAGSYIRSGGLAGTAKAGRVCGIVGIVFSVISLIFYIVFGIAVVQAAFDDYDYDDLYGLGSSHGITHETPLGGYSAYDAEEQAAIDAVNAQLDLLAAGDQAMLEAIGAMANEGFTSSLDITMEECGIDPVEYARAMTSGLTYQVSIVVADEESGGFVSYDVRCRDVFDVLDEFNDSLTDLQSSGAASLMSDDQLKARIGELFMQAVNDADFEDDFYVSLDVAYENNAWVIDPASWDDEMDYLFGLA